MAAQAPGPDPSERIFTELRSRNDEVKQRAAHELKDLVNLLSRGENLAIIDQKLDTDNFQNGHLNGSAHSTTSSQAV